MYLLFIRFVEIRFVEKCVDVRKAVMRDSLEDMLTIREGGTFSHPSLFRPVLVQRPVDGKPIDFRPGFPVVLLIRPQAEIS